MEILSDALLSSLPSSQDKFVEGNVSPFVRLLYYSVTTTPHYVYHGRRAKNPISFPSSTLQRLEVRLPVLERLMLQLGLPALYEGGLDAGSLLLLVCLIKQTDWSDLGTPVIEPRNLPWATCELVRDGKFDDSALEHDFGQCREGVEMAFCGRVSLSASLPNAPQH